MGSMIRTVMTTLRLLIGCAYHQVSGQLKLPYHSPRNIVSGVKIFKLGKFNSAFGKSRMLLVIMCVALPARASSIKKLSPSSRIFGRHK